MWTCVARRWPSFTADEGTDQNGKAKSVLLVDQEKDAEPVYR